MKRGDLTDNSPKGTNMREETIEKDRRKRRSQNGGRAYFENVLAKSVGFSWEGILGQFIVFIRITSVY